MPVTQAKYYGKVNFTNVPPAMGTVYLYGSTDAAGTSKFGLLDGSSIVSITSSSHTNKQFSFILLNETQETSKTVYIWLSSSNSGYVAASVIFSSGASYAQYTAKSSAESALMIDLELIKGSIITATHKYRIQQLTGSTDEADEYIALHPETDADIVKYDNTSSHISATNVQDAIDEIVSSGVGVTSVNNLSGAVSIVADNTGSATVTIGSDTSSGHNDVTIKVDALTSIAVEDATSPGKDFNFVSGIGLKTSTTDTVQSTKSGFNVDGTYNDSTNKIATVSTVTGAIGALDGSATIASKSGDVVTLKAGITETNGVVSNNSSADITLGTAAVKDYTTDTTLASSGETGKLPTAATVKTYVDNKITQGAEYLGTVSNTTTLYALDSSADEGDWCRATASFEYSSETVHVGDILVCTTKAVSPAHAVWDVIHTEVDTDTNTTYQAIVGASGTGYAGTIQLQYKNLGDANWTNQDTIKFINGSNVTITPDTTNKTITIAAVDTASAVDNILDGSNNGTAITYAPYTTQQSKLSFDTSSTAPSRTDRLNLNGKLFVTSVVTTNGVDAGSGFSTYGAENTTNAYVVIDDEDDAYEKRYGLRTIKNTTENGTYTLSIPEKTGTIAITSDIPSSFTLVDDILDGSANKYAPYASGDKAAGRLYSGTTNPTNSTRLNYDGYFYATKLYSNGQEVQPLDADLTAIAGLTGTSGLLRKTAANTWSLDTNTYLTANQGIKIKSGKKADGTTDIETATASGTNPILGDSGISAGTYSAVQVNTKGIAVAGGNIVEVGTSVGGNPSSSLATGGIFFQMIEA